MERDRQDIYTFVCRAPTGASLMVDLKPASGEMPPSKYARYLLDDHPSSTAVEVWDGDRLVDVVMR